MTSQVAPTRGGFEEVTPAGTGVCLVVECGRPNRGPATARGFCSKHYSRFRKYGDPLGAATLKGCGTAAGYHYHRNHGTAPCSDCVKANRAYNRKRQREQRKRDAAARARLDAEIEAIQKEGYVGRPSRSTLVKKPRHDDIWKDEGLCATFGNPSHFINPTSDAQVRKAIKLCRGCKVVEHCKVERNRLRAPGVWGGEYWTPAKDGVRLDGRFHGYAERYS